MKLKLIWFDLSAGLPIAITELKKSLGLLGTIRTLLYFVFRSVFNDPLKDLPKPSTVSEVFSYHQIRPAFILDDVLTKDLCLADDVKQSVLQMVITTTGAKYISTNVRIPSPAEWEEMSTSDKDEFTKNTMARFLNAEAKTVETPSTVFGFDVSHCHFAAICRKLNRSHLAPLFCGADQVYFERKEVLVQLNRKHTIAQGDKHCSFRFHFDDNKQP